MKQPTIYEANAFLYGYEELKGKPARLEYLPTERSRTWRKASLWISSYGEPAHEYAMRLLQQEGWHSFRFVAG